jgi:hypothetical protein
METLRELTEFELDAVVGGNGFKVSQVSIGNVAAQAVIGNVFSQTAVGSGAENEIIIVNNAGNLKHVLNG